MEKLNAACSASRKMLWILTLFMVIGIIPLAKASAYTIVGLFFYIVKQIDYDIWIYTFHGGYPQYITVFDFIKYLLKRLSQQARY